VKPTSNRYLHRIGSLVGAKEVLRAVEVFVAEHRSPDEELGALARRLGVSRIIEQSLPFEGGLFRFPHGELVIKLNSEGPYVRKRFTLAHEIGHLLLNTVPAFRSAPRTDKALERTCDLIAAELLMPTSEAVEFVRGLGSPSPEKLAAIASKYSVSAQTAAIRVHDDFKLWKCCIAMWEVSPNIKTLWFVGPRKWDDVRPSGGCLDLALASSNSIRIKDSWRRGVIIDPVWLNLLAKADRRVLGLVNFVN